MLFSLFCSVVIKLYCYCVALLLSVLSYVLIVCTVPLPPGANPIAVDKYININKCGRQVSCCICALITRVNYIIPGYGIIIFTMLNEKYESM